jgi:glycosyltransferase involved in cell wall biosynthesis
VLNRQGSLAAKLNELGLETVVIEKRDWCNRPIKYLGDIIRSMSFLRKHRIDLIHLNAGALGWKPPELIAAKLLKIPVLMHFHITTKNVTPFIRFANGIVAVSKNVADNSDFGSHPTRVVHNIADIDRFSNGKSIRDELGFDESDIIIGFLGQIKRIKGIELFLKLKSTISDPRVKYLIAGEIKDPDAAFRDEFSDQVSKDPSIKYVGYRTDPENIYATADILVMPSQWEEPCAMVLFETAAAQKPIIASRTGGTPEIIMDGINGLLFDKQDFDTLAHHVRRLIDNPEERSLLGRKAREVVEQHFTMSPVHQMERIYLETVGQAPYE